MIYEYTKFYLQDLNLDLLKIDGAEIAYFWTGKKMENQSERERERERTIRHEFPTRPLAPAHEERDSLTGSTEFNAAIISYGNMQN